MGCVYSRVEREEAVRRCRERRRLMKHLAGCRARFAAAHLAYLQALRNTGATLRQFAEADSSIAPGDAFCAAPAAGHLIRPPPSLPPLPPSPPPLPPFSPEDESRGVCIEQEEQTGHDSDAEEIPPASPAEDGAAWGLWDPFYSSPSVLASSVAPQNTAGATGALPLATGVDDWEETKTELNDEEDIRADNPTDTGDLGTKIKANDDPSAENCWLNKETEPATLPWLNRRRNLVEIVRDVDEYFLKASAGGTKVAALLESHRGCSLHQLFEETQGKNFKSAKVFSSLSWRRSARSPPSGGAGRAAGAANARQPGCHSSTLDNLLAEEQKLYKEVKEEETKKMEFGKKVALLRKQEAGRQDWTVTARTRSSMEALQMEIVSLQESITRSCASISRLRDDELLPQLLELCSGLAEMWRTMYECHEAQNIVAMQTNLHRQELAGAEPTSSSHLEAAAQLEAEVEAWHGAFHGLLRAQREYAITLQQWARLADCLSAGHSPLLRRCEEWLLSLDRLPEKGPPEAIKSFVSRVQSIKSQLAEEHRHQRRSARLARRLTRGDDDGDEDAPTAEESGKMAAKRKRLEEEKEKHLSSVRQSRAMIVQTLQTGLPAIFQALMGFAVGCAKAFEGIHRPPASDDVPAPVS